MKPVRARIAGHLAALGVGMSLAAGAQASTVYENAQVLSSTPIYRTVETSSPSRECWQEEVVRQDYRRNARSSSTPDILGAVIGGALGNAVGHNKRNKQVGAVVGALLGGSIARDIKHSNRSARSTEYIDVVERCRTVHNVYQEERLIGYDVRYRYNGSEHVTRMDHDPGSSLRVRINVEPVHY